VTSCSYEQYVKSLISPDRLYRLSEVLDSFEDCSIKGVYAWWLRKLPPFVPLGGTPQFKGMTLLYVGTSTRPLRERLEEHITDDTSRSTLRRSIGCLMAEQLGIEFVVKRMSRGARRHFGFESSGEHVLSKWMEENARVSWVQHDEPFLLEDHLIKTLTIPLNIKGNSHPFAKVLHSRRVILFRKARATSQRTERI
jgi:hypothetical protein